ncbi:MAG: 16S rRNA (adenine(1518)-N(6)/adenine(1519)-N(6))-dimethyltransferase RsmA [Oscillospiraceae bacterium]|nr:16S rRNA (adenine(1518)-N(6)/adenine(1519)-N(6))-dimethyltransferase RsmA [Oscillospiraceae bacterium]
MDIYDPAYIKSVLRPLGFTFSKARGQNFLIDPEIPRRMAGYIRDMTGGAPAGVLEIGPGFGALTSALLDASDKLAAIEVDHRLADVLESRYKERGNFTLLRGDALRVDLNALADAQFNGLVPVAAANLPYSVTSDMIGALIRATRYRAMLLMIQREVAARLTAPPATAEYGSFTVFARVFCETKALFDVPPQAFMPRPNVVSTVMLMTRRESALVPEDKQPLFFRISRASFAMRRKTLHNALSAAFPEFARQAVSQKISAAGIDPGVRGETRDISEFLRLCDTFSGT